MDCVRLAPSLRSQLCPFISTEFPYHMVVLQLLVHLKTAIAMSTERAAEDMGVPVVTWMSCSSPDLSVVHQITLLMQSHGLVLNTSPNQGQVQNTGCCSHSFSQRRPQHHTSNTSKDHCFLNKCIAERSLEERGGERNWGGGRNQDEGD